MSHSNTSITVHPSDKISGSLSVPGDKSISHRVAMLSGIAHGESEIRGFLRGEDCECTLNAMAQLGAAVDYADDVIRVTGTGGVFHSPAEPIYMGNSGTGIRLISGLLAGYGVKTTLTGDESLSGRPMHRVSDPLNEMGAELEVTGEKGTPPIKLQGGKVRPITYTLPMASAQVKSCVLLAGLCAEGLTTVVEPQPTRDHTERLFMQAGIPLHINGLKIELHGFGHAGPQIEGRVWQVPGDFSSASFWIVATAMRPGQTLTVENLGLNHRRTALLNVMERMGAQITVEVDPATAEGEPLGTLTVVGADLAGTEVFEDEIPNLIDELPLVAVAGAMASGKTEIRNAHELRVKETDRISSMIANLRNASVEVEEHEDGMTITGGAKPSQVGPIQSFGDHRMAMSMAVLAQCAESALTIDGIDCIKTSYPNFWEDLIKLGGRIS